MKNRTGKFLLSGIFAAGLLISCTFVSGAEESSMVKNRAENDGAVLSAAGAEMQYGEENVFYVTGEDYVPEGSVLSVYYGDRIEYSASVEQCEERRGKTYTTVRFAVNWPELDGSSESGTGGGGNTDGDFDLAEEERWWNIGDSVYRMVHGQKYRFFCIDQNYQGAGMDGKQAALFLCDSVIPADTGSFYDFKMEETGDYVYQFEPGPIVNFGESEDYKYSRIRVWLRGADRDFADALDVDTGVSWYYMGKTDEGKFENLNESGLRSFYGGHQKMTDRLFALSLDEALRYRRWLWRFGEAMRSPQENSGENPETQMQGFCRGYWLRTPMGDGRGAESGSVYAVDLVSGNIHPERIKPTEGRTDPELAVTKNIGVRPAFALPQRQ